MKLKFILSTAFALICAAASAQEKETPEYEFTTIVENPVTSIKNQYRSGTCWCFSALSFIESEILRTKGDTTDLSEMFVVGKSYHDRAEKYVRLDGHLNFAAGSSFGDVLHVIKDYGIVPQDAMPGFNYGTDKPEHNELDAVLTPVLKAAVPLSGSARKDMYRFVSVCAGLLEGGLPVAVDWAILLWVVPALENGSKQYHAVKELLNEYPLSLAKL